MDIDELFGCASARKGAARLPGPATPGGVHGAVAPLSIDDLFSPCARLPTATPAGPQPQRMNATRLLCEQSANARASQVEVVDVKAQYGMSQSAIF